MARTTPTFEMGGNELVLGLLIERPGTSYELEQRLKSRFGSSQFGRGTASNAMKRLAVNGLVRVAEQRLPRASRAPGRPHKITYVPTRAGIEHFRRWMRAAVSIPPVREELHAKIALCEPADLPVMIAAVRDAEKKCVLKLQGLQWRIQGDRVGTARRDWQQRMELLARSGDVHWWDTRIKWLQNMRIALERELQRYEAERPPTP